MFDTVIKNARIVSHEPGIRQGDIVISGGKIVDIIDAFDGEASFIYDVSGKYVLPGIIDAHVHFRDPGLTKKEDFVSGSRAAVSGGITTVFDMPNTDPPNVSLSALIDKRRRILGRSFCHYGFYFGATAHNLHDLEKVSNVAGIKYYISHSTGGLGVPDMSVLERIFEHTNKLVAVHAEDESIIQRNFQLYEDEVIGIGDHGKIRSREAAYEATLQALTLAQKYKHRLHVCHVTTQDEVDLILRYRSQGVLVTFEITPHHLFLTEEEGEKQGFFVKVNPPLRTHKDTVSLWKALESGDLDMIATDHAPHLKSEKHAAYKDAPSGVPGVETMLPLLLHAMNKRRSFALHDIVRLMSYNPARIFGLHSKGAVIVGYDADLVVCDLELERVVENESLYTKCGWSPFHGWKLRGWPVMTFVSGMPVYRDGKVDENFRCGKEVEFHAS
ncbi:dihydroorotase [Candidatus Peregrinibacteria bacterium]|nr:dihydroorotase [Candidatus Peregrinibacteria bacterium]